MVSKSPLVSARLTLKNDGGLHTHAAAMLADAVQDLQAHVVYQCGDLVAHGRSLLELVTLCADKGAEIDVRATGAEAAVAVQAIRELFDNGFSAGGIRREAPAAAIPPGAAWGAAEGVGRGIVA